MPKLAFGSIPGKKKQDEIPAATLPIPSPTNPFTAQNTPPPVSQQPPISAAPNPVKKVTLNPDGTITHDFGTLTQEQQQIRNEIEMGKGTAAPSFNKTLGNPVNPVFDVNAQNKQLADIQQQAQPLIQQIGKPTNQKDQLAAQEGNPVIETGQALAAGVAGAVAGAGVGSFAGPIGTAVGGIVGFIGGAAGSMSWDEKQKVKNANKLFMQSKTNMGIILNNAKNDPVGAVMAFNEQKQNIATAKAHLKLENQNLKKYLSGGYEEMVALETWEQVNIPILEAALARQISDPKAQPTNFNFAEADLTQ